MRLLFTLQYLGTRYGGWQAQTNALSVQQVVEEALARIFNEAVRIHGAVIHGQLTRCISLAATTPRLADS